MPQKTKRRWLPWAAAYIRRLAGLDLQLYAANASFFLLISAFPAAMLLMTLLKFLPLDASDMLAMTSGVLPPATQGLAEYLISDLYAADSSTAISLSLVMALWSASRGTLAVLGGVNAAYGADDTRSWICRRALSMVYMLGMLLALVLTLALHAFGGRLQELLLSAFPSMGSWLSNVMHLRTVIVLLVLVLFFQIIYTAFPHRRVRFVRQLPGAVLAAVGWLGFSSVYSLYIEHFGNVSVLYGSLTAVVVTMLWLYFSMCIVFFGATLNEWLEHGGIWPCRDEQARPLQQ